MNAKIFIFAAAAITFVTCDYPCYIPEKTCTIKEALKGTRSDVFSEELEVEEPAMSHRRRMLTIEVKPVHRCKSQLCISRDVQVGITGMDGRLEDCPYSSYTSKFSCKSRRHNAEIRVVWERYQKELSLNRINRAVSVQAVMPIVDCQELSFSDIKACQIPKCKVVITEKIQGRTCPKERKRFNIGSTQNLTIRTLDGRLNNPYQIFNGAVGEELLRLSGNGFADKVYVPAGACSKAQRKKNKCPFPKENNGTGSNRPSPRVISNELLRQNRNIYSSRGLSDLIVYFGQFLSHDTALSKSLPNTTEHKRPNDVEIDFEVPKGDVIFDSDSKGNQTLSVRRFNFDGCTGEEHNKPRQLTATLAAVLDASTVYGHKQERLKVLRAYKDGLMKTDSRNFLPLNTFGLEMANAIERDPSRLRAAGDVRANQSPILFVLHTLFVREHNRIAKEYKKKHPSESDETIFQYARKMVIAEIQAITYREYIPSILGRRLPRYRGYDPSINTGVATEFNEATYRYGHSQVNSKVFRFDENGEVSRYGHVLLREGFFHPERVTEEGGLEPILRGAVIQRSQEIDTKVVDELRNFLFPKNGVGFDLPAINIERGRDAGIPDYNSVRKALKLERANSFDEITEDRKVAKTLKSLYTSVDNLDLYVAGLAEDHLRGSELGPTFQKIFMDQWKRIRDGDRFWYTRVLSKKEIKEVHRNTLSRIIRRNTKLKHFPKHVFFSIDHCRDVKNFQCVRR